MSRCQIISGRLFERQFDEILSQTWLDNDRSITVVTNDLEAVLRTIPDQAGKEFECEGRKLPYIDHQGFCVVYEIFPDDCQARLCSVKILRYNQKKQPCPLCHNGPIQQFRLAIALRNATFGGRLL